MSGIKPKSFTKSRIFKVVRYLLAAIGVVVCLLAAVLLSLPSIISADWTRGQVERQLAAATGKPATLESLSFSWAQGLRLQALHLGAGQLADPQFLASLQDLHADISLTPLLRGELHLLLELRGLRLRVPFADRQEPAPPPKPMPDALRELFTSLRTGLAPRPFGLDAHVRVDLSDIDVRIEPAPGGKALELHRLSLFLESKGLKHAPVALKAGLNIAREDAPPIPVRLVASLAGLNDGADRLNPAQASLDVLLDAPGLELIAAGSLAKGLHVAVKSQLGETLNAVRPLLPPTVPELDGALALSLTATQTVPDRLDLGLTVRADGLRAANGSLGNKAAGPITLKLLQTATLNLKAETASLPGSLEVGPSSQVRWVAGLDGVADGKPRATLSLTETRLVLNELLPALRAFLPPGLSLGQAELALQRLDLASTLPAPGDKQNITVSLKGLKLWGAKLSRRDSSGELSIGQAQMLVDSASLSLPGAAPGRAEASVSARLDGIRISGATPAAIRQLSLPRLSLQADTLSRNASALFGVAGNAALELEAQAQGIEARGKAAVPTLTTEVRLRAALPAAKSASMHLLALNLDAPLLRVLQPGKKAIELPLTLRASAPEITLSGTELTPGLHNLALNLDLGQALRGEVQASLTGPAGHDLNTQGTLSLDAHKTLALASAFAPRKAKASGALSLDWKLAAVLPGPATAPKATPKTLKQRLQEISFLHVLDASLRLDNLSLDWPLAAAPGQEPETLRLRGVTTSKPLRITARDGIHEASLAGTLAFGPMDSLPGVGKLSRPLRGLLTVNAAQQDGRSVQVSQLLHLDGLDLDQNLSITLDKLDGVLDRDQDRLAAVLELVDGTVSFSLATGLSALPPSATAKGLSGAGRMEAGAEARLSGGRSLALSARLISPGMDLRVGPELALEGLSSTLRLSRRYLLLRGLRCPGEQEQAAEPLSEQVFDLYPAQDAARAAPGGVALSQLLRSDASRTTAGAFGLARLRFKSGGLPLDIRDIQLQLDDSGPVPGLRSFRAGLLGGDVLGSAMLHKSAGLYSLTADLAFTGIDPSRLLPEKSPRDLGAQAETTGRISLSLPLTPNPEELLRRLNFRADITKIGPRTLERLLYALDPDEQNETIVQQRRLMGIGYPRNLRIAAAYGNLSLTGAVEVKGFQLDLPPLDRLAIANLPLKKQLSKPLAAVPGLIKILDAASGSLICREPAGLPGALRVVEPASQGVSR